MSNRVFLAGLFHETHSFVDDRTPLSAFEIRRGNDMLPCTGDSSPLGGVLEAGKNWNWQFTPAADYRCVPSGTVEDEVLESFWDDFQEAWQRNPHQDAIYLVLHGAMLTPSYPDAEGEILRRIRELAGKEIPIFGVYDLHANFSPAMAEHASALVAYRENPHTDAREAAVRAAEFLQRHFTTGELPYMVSRQTPFLWPPTGTGTQTDPMKSLEALARQIESEFPEIWTMNISPGFAFGDTPFTWVNFQAVTTGLREVAEIQLDRLEALARELNEAGNARDESLDAVMARLDPKAEGLTVLVEPSDNIGGGAPGDCTGLLRAFIAHQVNNAAVCLNDPESVAQLKNVGPGERATLALGGKGSRFDEGPVTLAVEVISKSGGRFELEDKQSHLASMCGDFCEMGPCAVVRYEGIRILLTSHKTAPFDLGQWRSQGIDPAKLSVIAVKAAVAHRRAYDKIAARQYWVDTPGPCRSDLRTFPFTHRPRVQ